MSSTFSTMPLPDIQPPTPGGKPIQPAESFAACLQVAVDFGIDPSTITAQYDASGAIEYFAGDQSLTEVAQKRDSVKANTSGADKRVTPAYASSGQMMYRLTADVDHQLSPLDNYGNPIKDATAAITVTQRSTGKVLGQVSVDASRLSIA